MNTPKQFTLGQSLMWFPMGSEDAVPVHYSEYHNEVYAGIILNGRQGLARWSDLHSIEDWEGGYTEKEGTKI